MFISCLFQPYVRWCPNQMQHDKFPVSNFCCARFHPSSTPIGSLKNVSCYNYLLLDNPISLSSYPFLAEVATNSKFSSDNVANSIYAKLE